SRPGGRDGGRGRHGRDPARRERPPSPRPVRRGAARADRSTGAPRMSALAEPLPPAGPAPVPAGAPLVEVHDLVKLFPIPGGVLQRPLANAQAVDGVNFTTGRGETLGLVGESGCGKTTVGRLILRLIDPTSGAIVFDGVDIARLKGKALKPYRKRMQIIFQD